MTSTTMLRESYLKINDKVVGKFQEELGIQARRPLQYLRTYALLTSESLDRLDEYIKSDPEDTHPEVDKIMEEPVRNNFKLFLEIAQNEKKAAVKDIWTAYTTKLKDLHESLFTLFSFFGTEKNYALTKKGLVLPRCAGTYIPFSPLDPQSDDPDSALCDVFLESSKAHDTFMFGWLPDEETIDDTRWDRQRFDWITSSRPPIACPTCLQKRITFRESLSKEQLAKLQKEKVTPETTKNIDNMKKTIEGYANAVTAIKTYTPLIDRIKYSENDKKPEEEQEEEEEQMEVDDAVPNGDDDENDKKETENVVKRVDEDETTTDKPHEYNTDTVPETPGKGIFDEIRDEEGEKEEVASKKDKGNKSEKTPTKHESNGTKSHSVQSSPAASKTTAKSADTPTKPKAQKRLNMDDDEDDFQKPKEIKKTKPAAQTKEEQEEKKQDKDAMEVENKQPVEKKATETKQAKPKAKKESEDKPKPPTKKGKVAAEESKQTTSKKRKRAEDEEEENGGGDEDMEEKSQKPPAKKQKTTKSAASKGKKPEPKEDEEKEPEDVKDKPKTKKKPTPKQKQADLSNNDNTHVNEAQKTGEIANGFKVIENAILMHFSDPRLSDQLKEQFGSISNVARVFIKTLIGGHAEHQ